VSIQLTIFERLNDKTPPKLRKRIINITAESVTVGNHESCDLQLKSFSEAFTFEIKHSDEGWWLVNPHRLESVQINGKTADLENRLKRGDQIIIDGHKIIFQQKEKAAEVSPDFLPHPGSDQALWDYLISAKAEFDEIMINGASQVYVDWRGVIYKSPYTFSSNEFLTKLIKKNTKESDGWVSWRLDRTLRIQAALPPQTEEPHLSVRKAKSTVMSLDELLHGGFGSIEQIQFLKDALAKNQSIIISGGTSTGKTVLLRSLVEQIPAADRVIVIEEEAETDWPHPHAVAIESGRGKLRESVIECLRMRPTKLIVSEVRGAEAFEMLQAMNTGHEGSMTTIHSNSAREALARLESLVLSAGVPLTVNAVRRNIAQAVDIIVQLKREPNGKRLIDHIVRVTGVQNDTILLSDPVGLEAAGIKQQLSLVDS
jgi:pilus assembly protein CpaF